MSINLHHDYRRRRKTREVEKDMKEYRFPKDNNRICYISAIIAVILLIIALLNWMKGIWFFLPIGIIGIPIFVYLFNKNGTGLIRYDDNSFEIISDVFGGSNVRANWESLKEVTIQLRFSNIILNFGKSGVAAFGVDRLDFKLFALEMMKFLISKKELADITKNYAFVKEIDLLTFDESDKIAKKHQNKIGYLQLLHVLLSLVLMFAMVMGITEVFNHFDVYSKYKHIRILIPVFVIGSLWISIKVVSVLFAWYFKSKEKKAAAAEKNK